uniref:MPN domain-containing protein n=1 Tax=Catharus ustulatus TaxID=91951 RepID=A0A8C3VAF7_CATUS
PPVRCPLTPPGGAGRPGPPHHVSPPPPPRAPGGGGSGGSGGSGAWQVPGGGGVGSGAKAAGGPRGAVLTRRGITLRVLLRDGLLEPGRGVLSIYYLGKKFVGDLGSDGTITWQETGQVFNSPSAWATHCKRLVNPAKKSGCGWASVRYKGQKLDQYKAAWLRKHQPNVPPPEEVGEEEEEAAREGRVPLPDAGKRLEVKPRVPVRYCTLGTRDSARNPQTLVEVTSFAAINKFQPFNVAISSNVLLLLDFHSHLTRSEVVGYLGGRWDTNTQLLTVLRAFPCRTRLGDAEAAGAVEEEICQSLFLRGLSLVGWYHSHPFGPALPSLHDIDAQMDYQLKLQGSGNGFQPCLGLICGPFYHGNPGVESKIAPFWVMPPPEVSPIQPQPLPDFMMQPLERRKHLILSFRDTSQELWVITFFFSPKNQEKPLQKKKKKPKIKDLASRPS